MEVQPQNDADVNATADSLAKRATLNKFEGLDEGDHTAEVHVKGVKSGSMYQSAKTFAELGLSQQLLDGVHAMGWNKPSKIQAQALPYILAEPPQNVIGQAHHGSGKTGTFALGMLARADPQVKSVQCLCVSPTRELTVQLHNVVKRLAKFSAVESFLVVPGSPKGPITAQIMVGTPGSILGRFRFRDVDPRGIRLMVCDEADVMMDQKGMLEQTMEIRKKLPRTCQMLLFSATYPQRVRKFAAAVAPSAARITIKREDLTLDNIYQFTMVVNSEPEKFDTLTNIYGLLNIGQSIIFVQTVRTAKELSNRMRHAGYTVSVLHGRDMQPEERDRTMEDFRAGKTTVLITTNVLARGIDVLQVTLVVNYDVPTGRQGEPDPETYIHRVGRSGRFGRKGVAINFVHDERSRAVIQAIEQYYSTQITEVPGTDLEKIESLVKTHL